jgi:NADP-dependent 3-hydroxy acid dehydrogenase YdfG
MSKKDLAGKVIIITGASSGIGEATAHELAAAGASLVLAARREGRLNKLAEEIGGQGGEMLALRTDLNEQRDIQRLVGRTLAAFGRIDVLINNAGWGAYGWIEETKPDHLQKQFAVNVIGPLQLIRLVVPIMKDHGSGHIINISSYASRVAVPPQTIYAGTKYAIEGLSDGLRRELAPWGIRVSRVHPGGVKETEFNEKAARRGGVGFTSPGIGSISKEFVARKLHRLILYPRAELKLGRLYDAAEALNKLAPWAIDLALRAWVSRKRGL